MPLLPSGDRTPASGAARQPNPGAIGLTGFDLERFQQEVAAEIGIDLNRAAARYPAVRHLEPATHTRGGGGQTGGR